MSRIQKNCFAASMALHALLLAVLLLAPAFSRREKSVQTAPVLEILPGDFKVTTDGTVRGGPTPAAPPKQVAPQPQPAAAPKLKPPEPTKPEPAKPEPAHRIAVAPEPVRSAPKPQDQEPGRKQEKKIEKESQAIDNRDAKSGVRVSTNKFAATDAERQRRDADRRDAAAAAERERLRRGAERIARLLGQSEEALKSGLSSNTEITMPGAGGGGPVQIDYFSYLQAFYQSQWNRRKPANVSVKLALVKARITISRAGAVTAHAIYEPSGISPIDDSVRRVLNENKQLKPLPAEFKDGEITVTITFKVEGEPSA